ncbi:hypothetical protein HSR122_1571 [Halapricum desulfuricans]|uniref:Uncharacterized protein n=1 Tax=Halapricum desulfuricans TaxID=2841257 RepID=A0A897N844_9EURY|nr:hypothetical protein HSR122_1571 [Halapricum desulfuricans]
MFRTSFGRDRAVGTSAISGKSSNGSSHGTVYLIVDTISKIVTTDRMIAAPRTFSPAGPDPRV